MFYALATNKENQNLMIDNLSNERHLARQDAERHCKKNGLLYKGLYFVQGSSKQAPTLTKFAKKRKLEKEMSK